MSYHFAFGGALTVDAAIFLERETQVPFGHLDMREWFTVTAYNEHEAIVGVLTMEPRNWFDWHLSCAIRDQRIMSFRLLRTIFKTVFSRAVRVTALVEPDNERALNQVRRMGFQYEGFIRCGIEGNRDAMMFGMLRRECRFLQMRPPLSKLNRAHRHLVDPETDGNGALGAGVGADSKHVGGRQLGVLVALAALVPLVAIAFHQIVPPGRPAEMPWIDAARDTAAVGRVVPIGRLTVGETADDAVYLAASLPFPRHLRIAALVDRQRPQEAVIASVGEGSGDNLFPGHAGNNKEA